MYSTMTRTFPLRKERGVLYNESPERGEWMSSYTRRRRKGGRSLAFERTQKQKGGEQIKDILLYSSKKGQEEGDGAGKRKKNIGDWAVSRLWSGKESKRRRGTTLQGRNERRYRSHGKKGGTAWRTVRGKGQSI